MYFFLQQLLMDYFRLGQVIALQGQENGPAWIEPPPRSGQKQDKIYCENTKKRPLRGIVMKGTIPKIYVHLLNDFQNLRVPSSNHPFPPPLHLLYTLFCLSDCRSCLKNLIVGEMLFSRLLFQIASCKFQSRYLIFIQICSIYLLSVCLTDILKRTIQF